MRPSTTAASCDVVRRGCVIWAPGGPGLCMLAVVDDARVRAGDGHAAWSESFNEMFAQIAGVFSNAAVRRHGRWYLLGLLSHEERKNSWWLAEFAGDVSPDGMQRLLNFSPWDEDAAGTRCARYVARSMGDPAAVLAVDETGFLKKGRMSAGVARMYTGTAGRIENAQVGVFAGLCHPGRQPGPDRPGAVPAGEVDGGPGPVPGGRDRRRCRVRDEAGAGPEDDRARREGGSPVLLGGRRRGLWRQPELRKWLEEQEIPYVMAVVQRDDHRGGLPARRRARGPGPAGRVAAAELRRRVQGAAALRLGAHRHRSARTSPAGPPVPGPARRATLSWPSSAAGRPAPSPWPSWSPSPARAGG